MAETPVYMIVMLDVKDMDAFMSDYAGPLQAHRAKHGVETLVATPTPEVLEGTYDKTITVVLKFPSADARRAWYADPDYQTLLKRRFELTDTATTVALVAPQFGAKPSPTERPTP
ncbi:MAG: DUF1330 domain-containing protein [Hyphomicrobiales bacterium]